ncbi:lactonase family protein [Streptococcus merionis]|uniref:lactonase family protein n=1 Tax=Streptococcus merionis TaxID=400065 RepID=UPI0026EA4C10|nr:lactonase family protein [Streptococcus merionis]
MTRYAYVGCRTTKERGARGKGIKVFAINENNQWTLVQLVKDLVNPSYLCFDQTGTFLYAIHGDFSEISAFSVEATSGQLTYLNTVSTQGLNPVHLSVNKTNQYIFVANLQTGTVATIPIEIDGSLGQLKFLESIPGLKEGSISHPHQVAQDQTGDFLLVSCQGRLEGFGQVDVFKIDHDTGELSCTERVRSREIAEPRHLVVHQNNKWVYGVNEKDYSITYYHFEERIGKLMPKQILPTLPDTYTGDGWASGIVLTTSGKYVIVSNRKHDSVTSFKINPNTGYLSYCDCIKTGGEQPRFIVFDSQGQYLLAANELSDRITGFFIDETTGKFSASNFSVETESPVCVIFSE